MAMGLAAMLGLWQQQVGVGTLLRQAADASTLVACLWPGVKVGGGQRRSLCTAHIVGGAGQGWVGAAAHASLALLGLLLLAMVGCWG